MTINFNANPYWDDFDPSKNYKRIVSVPGRVEQSREFTQIQTMAQHQVTLLGDSIYRNGQIISGCLTTVNDAKTLVTVSPGVTYADGEVLTFTTSTSIAITGVGVEVIGLVKTESIITELEDASLKDPAVGYDNYQEPGAHRLKVIYTWELLSDTGYGVFTFVDGVLPVVPTPTTVTEDVLDIIARRDFEKSGNYTLEGLEVSLQTHPTYPFDLKQLTVKSGVARILGYNVTLLSNNLSDFEPAKVTEIEDSESHSYQTYDELHDISGDVLLGSRPVAYVDRVVATELTVDGTSAGGVTRSTITRGNVPGGSDLLSRTSVVAILAVNQGGTWDPSTEDFSGGTTFANTTYLLDGNRISWSPSGSEPSAGSSYSVAYTYRKVLTKQIMAKTLVSNEARVHNDTTGNILTNPYVCETNDYTEIDMYLTDAQGSGTPGVDFETDYIRDTDFVVTYDGLIDWYDYDIQILEVTKGGINSVESLVGFTDSFTMGDILAVSYYETIGDMSWDDYSQSFINPDISYGISSDFVFTRGVANISWATGESEPAEGDHYFVAVNARKYKTSNHPTAASSYYAAYYYWNSVVDGDYLARDSFYKTWLGIGNVSNELQHYGLDITDRINFWRAYACSNYAYNLDKPYPETQVEVTYRYYLSRYACVYLHKTDGVIVNYGASSVNPGEPLITGDNSQVMLATIYCPADSMEVYAKKAGIKTFKMTDHHKMKQRVQNTEEELSRTWLDIDAKSIPIANKKGIMTTSFTSNERLDPGWSGSAYSIDPYWEELAMPHVDSFYSLEVDTDSTTATVYQDICSVVPNGTTYIEQADYSGNESIAPYALTAQTAWEKAPSAYMTISPTGDTLVIPRTQVFTTQTDAEAWLASDVSKLSNPSQWFSNGWTGGLEKQYMGGCGHAGWYFETESSQQTETLTSNYIRDIQRNCRQIVVSWDVPGGLIPTSEAQLDYFIYFGGTLVTPTLTNSTPPGSLPNSFRPRSATNGASGTFMIPPNIPEGRIEVKIMSTPMVITDEQNVSNDWRQVIVCVFDAAVVEQLTMQFTRCRCNCYCNCWCNCWDCRGRCGTGPLAQTIEPVGTQRVLKELEIDFSTTSFTYGVFACLVKTDNGQPTSNTVSNGMVARKFLSASQLAGGGAKTYTFDTPLFMKDDAYAIVVTGEDRFNLNSIAEVAAGRDIRCKVAKMGEISSITGKVIGSQPFKAGILWRSLTGVTWEQDQKSDLKFKATFNTYPTNQDYYVYLAPVSVTDATSFLCTWDSEMSNGTLISFEYKTPTGKWTGFEPYSLTYLNEVSDTLYFRAKLSTTVSNITPFCSKYAGLYVQSQSTSLKAVTNNFEPEESDICDIYLDVHLPSGYAQDINVTFDNGATWVDLANSLNGQPTGNLVEYFPVDLNADNVKYTHHWRVTLSSPSVYTDVRVSIECSSSSSDAKLLDPRYSKLIVIASIT